MSEVKLAFKPLGWRHQRTSLKITLFALLKQTPWLSSSSPTMNTPSSCTTLVLAALMLLGDESDQGIYLTEKHGWWLSSLFCSVTFSVGSEFPVPICDVAPESVSRVKAMRSGNVQARVGIWEYEIRESLVSSDWILNHALGLILSVCLAC